MQASLLSRLKRAIAASAVSVVALQVSSLYGNLERIKNFAVWVWGQMNYFTGGNAYVVASAIFVVLVVVWPNLVAKFHQRFPKKKTASERLAELEASSSVIPAMVVTTSMVPAVAAAVARIGKQLGNVPDTIRCFSGLVLLSDKAVDISSEYVFLRKIYKGFQASDKPFSNWAILESENREAVRDWVNWLRKLRDHRRSVQDFGQSWDLTDQLYQQDLFTLIDGCDFDANGKEAEVSGGDVATLIVLHWRNLIKVRNNYAAKFSEHVFSIATISQTDQSFPVTPAAIAGVTHKV